MPHPEHTAVGKRGRRPHAGNCIAAIHVLRDRELAYLSDAQLQILDAGRRDRYENGGMVEVLVVSKAVFQVVPGTDSVGEVIEVRVCVTGVLDFAAVDANLLPDFLHHAFFGLSFPETDPHRYLRRRSPAKPSIRL